MKKEIYVDKEGYILKLFNILKIFRVGKGSWLFFVLILFMIYLSLNWLIGIYFNNGFFVINLKILEKY